MFGVLLTVVFVLAALLAIAIWGLVMKNTNVIYKSKKRLEGKTVLVSGGTTGMGLEKAKDFARRGARVLIAGPVKAEGLDAVKSIIKETENDNVAFKLLNMASLKSVRRFCEGILTSEDRLDILMNNAGIGFLGNGSTEDGMHKTLQINFYGHFLVTLLLLPLLSKTGTATDPSRIVNTASILHRVGLVDMEKVKRLKKIHYIYGLFAYGSSKLYLVLFSRELTRRLKAAGAHVVMNNVDPGAVGTNIFNQLSMGIVATCFCYYFSKTPFEGAQTALYVALDKKTSNVSGEFFKDCKLTRAKSVAYDEKNAMKVWEESVRLVGLTDDEVEHSFMV